MTAAVAARDLLQLRQLVPELLAPGVQLLLLNGFERLKGLTHTFKGQFSELVFYAFHGGTYG